MPNSPSDHVDQSQNQKEPSKKCTVMDTAGHVTQQGSLCPGGMGRTSLPQLSECTACTAELRSSDQNT